MAETIKVLVSEEEVEKRIRDLGEKISKDYEGKQVHLICVLKGGVFFMCELAKRITVPVSMDFNTSPGKSPPPSRRKPPSLSDRLNG